MTDDALRMLIQEERFLSAEDKLNKALGRLIGKDGEPLRTKKKGRLTLNKINNEAGLGRSYIHKFKEFVDKIANPAIEEYNEKLNASATSVPVKQDMSEFEKIREELKYQIELKDTYRRERDEVLAINDELEALNKSLMFRIYELQQELSAEVVEYEYRKK